uniref:Replication-associated protein n=1 Tax=Chickpea chlorotic dwarf virus TaxID=463360 RepID=A0A0A1ES76_9GEMI|nr:replication-associated protein [Chickpea chlorotic dwarf virus]
MPSANKNFRFQSKYVFLTYPKCSSQRDDLFEFLWEKLTPFLIFFLGVATELHQDGTTHYHALVQLDKKPCIRDPSFFDFEGNHPNIQPARNSKQVLDYISKDGDIKTRGDFRDHKVSPRKSDARWRTIIQTATSKEEYLDMIKEEFPHEWATKLQWLEYSANKLFPPQPEAYVSPFTESDLRCHEDLAQWRDTHLYQDERRPGARIPSLYICGPTRTGKTTWARSLGRHNYWNGTIDFTTYDEHATYNVIDDIPFKFVPLWKQLIGCQFDFTVNPKYGKKKKIKGGVPSIILTNRDEDWIPCMSEHQKEYFTDNCEIHYMDDGETFFARESSSH